MTGLAQRNATQRSLLTALRSGLFYFGFVGSTVLWGSLCVLLAWVLPYRWRFKVVIGWWTGFVLLWLRLTCGIDVRTTGTPAKQACVVLAKHSSTWEALYLQGLYQPQATLVKKELLNIPFFGWAYRLLRPIAIDRRSPRQGLKRLIDQGQQHLREGSWVVLFPEGTRARPGEQRSFQAGGAALARAADAPIQLVAHTAAYRWPAHRLMKHPGTIDVVFSEPFYPAGRSSKEITELAEAWMRRTMAQIESSVDAQALDEATLLQPVEG
ncbi:MAG: lysophospholipid acyltransferase family protein [Pseudomonadota bacterium]